MNAKPDTPVLRTVQHATFTVERIYDAPAALTYSAWADPARTARWFGGTPGEWDLEIRDFDFRVGGRERLRGRWKNGTVSDFQATYYDILPEQRIMWVYDMYIDSRRISVSLATAMFKTEGGKTRLTYTEQGAFLDGYDDAGSRERGTRVLLERVSESLKV